MVQVLLLITLMAIVSMVARAVYCLWLIHSGGGSELLEQIPIARMLFEIMQLHWFALYGAIAGLALFLLTAGPRAWRALTEEPRVRGGYSPHSLRPDANDLLRKDRERAARSYLEKKREERADGDVH